MVIGIYFFKFPNRFAFGGVTSFSTVFSQLLHCSASTFTTAANYALLVLGFIFLGKSVGVRTVYATIVMSVSLQVLDALVPMHGTLTDQPMLRAGICHYAPRRSVHGSLVQHRRILGRNGCHRRF